MTGPTNRQRILTALSRRPAGLDDDELATASGVQPRQQVNRICRRLAADGILLRDVGLRGKIVNRLREQPGVAAAQAGERGGLRSSRPAYSCDPRATLFLFPGSSTRIGRGASGAAGRGLLEALSRGASRATFVERDRGACRVISENLEKLRLTGATVLCRDVLDVLREERARERRYDLVLVDAPYEEWRSFEAALGELVPGVLSRDGLLVVETADRVEPQLPLDLVTSRRYGSARITVFSR